jgi:hypothetical protein
MKPALLGWIAISAAWGQLQLGPAPGAAAPDFSLVDQSGQRRSLDSLMGPQGLMLVFFRSADW